MTTIWQKIKNPEVKWENCPERNMRFCNIHIFMSDLFLRIINVSWVQSRAEESYLNISKSFFYLDLSLSIETFQVSPLFDINKMPNFSRNFTSKFW